MDNIGVKKLFGLNPNIFYEFFPEGLEKSKFSNLMNICPLGKIENLKPESLLPENYHKSKIYCKRKDFYIIFENKIRYEVKPFFIQYKFTIDLRYIRDSKKSLGFYHF